MAEVVQEKSRGLKFAEQQLLRHGWEHGKGLGRAENGISEAIKVKVKCDKGGVGHKEGEQFTFHWWDHVFNKASSSLQVQSDQNGIKLKKTTEEDEDSGMISNKKPRKAALARAKLYGCFVKSATLLSGQEQPEPKSSNSDESSSSDEEEDQKLDLSSTTKLSDADLMKACGGRTAHKGARHGLTMSAKLARLEQQEAEFMAKYGKKSQPTSASAVCVAQVISQSAEPGSGRQEQVSSDPQGKKMKKKRSSGSINELNGDNVSENPETDVKPKKKKKEVREKAEETTVAVSTKERAVCEENGEVDQSHKRKRKHKKKKNKEENEETAPSHAADCRSPEEIAELHTDTKEKKKKKKKSSKHRSEEEERKYAESCQSEVVQDCEESTVKPKRKKCKKDKLSTDICVSVDNSLSKEELLPKKKKKKKSIE